MLRIKHTEDLSDDFNGIASTQEIVRYDWVSPNYRYLLFHTEEIIIRDFLGNEQSRSTVTYYSTPEVINSTEQVNALTQKVQVYPNPSLGYLQLELPAASLGQRANICIYNAQGQCVYQQSQTKLSEQLIVNQLAAGYYRIKIQQGKNHYQTAFIKS